MARATHHSQALLEPETGAWTAPDVLANEEPNEDGCGASTPSLYSQDEKDYADARGKVEQRRAQHDALGDKYLEHFRRYRKHTNPTATHTEFGPFWCDECDRDAANLKNAEKKLVEIRDAVLRAGGEPLSLDAYRGMPNNRHDWPEFAGRHPDDGNCSSKAPTVQEARKKHRRNFKPAFDA
jgi:hypothetical protein